MFLTITVTLAFLIHILIAWRITRPAPMRRYRRFVFAGLTALFALMTFTPLSWRFDLGFLSYETYRPLRNLSYVAMGLYSFIFTAFLFREIAWALARAASTKVPILPEDPTRRDVLGHGVNLGMLGVAAAGATAGYAEAKRRARVAKVRIPIPDLPTALDGFRIVQLSDIHIGPTIQRGYVEAIAETVNRLNADLIALTGDIVDAKVSRIHQDVAPLAGLVSKHGIFVCTGNHEYYAGAEAWIAEFRRLGMRVLLNEHAVVEHGGARLLVAGVTDPRSERFVKSHVSDPKACLSGAPNCDVRLLLAHRPRSIYEAAEAGFDLQLSGHTHGGQFFPWNLVVNLVHEFPYGLARHLDTWLYVSRGTGYFGPPFRMLAPSEITEVTLVAG